jgi:glycerol-3-phosphate cytidylyltransferase
MTQATVITYGTFDLFHFGHVRLLQRLKSLGDRLVVGCSTDEFNAVKGKRTVIPYDQRVEVLASCRYVDAVFPENDWQQKRNDVLSNGAKIFAMGDDWAGHFDNLQDIVQVVYLPRTEDISSTDVKRAVGARFENELIAVLNELKQAQARIAALIA